MDAIIQVPRIEAMLHPGGLPDLDLLPSPSASIPFLAARFI
jgi:hypothetical protein